MIHNSGKKASLKVRRDEDTFLRVAMESISKRADYARKDAFDICAMLNTDLRPGVPGTDEASTT